MAEMGFTKEKASAVRYTGAQDESAGFREDRLVVHANKTPVCAEMSSLIGINQFGALRELQLVGVVLGSLSGIEEVSKSLQALRIDQCLNTGLKPLDMSPVLSAQFPQLQRYILRAVDQEVVVIPKTMPALKEFSLLDEKQAVAVELQGLFKQLHTLKCARAISLKSITGAKQAPNLQALSLFGSRQCCFPVDLPQSVSQLDLSYTGIPLLHITYLRGIRQLTMAANALNDLVGIEDIPGLEELDVRQNCLNNLHLLEGLVNLRRLDASENKIRMLNGLEKMEHLQELHCQDNEVQSLLPLAACFSLTRLYLQNNRIRELQGLEKLINLATLDVTGNRIQAPGELTILVNFQQLKELGILKNPIVAKKEGVIMLAQSLSQGCTQIIGDEETRFIQQLISMRGSPRAQLPEAKAKVYRMPKQAAPIVMEAHFKTIKDPDGQYTTIETIQLGDKSQAVQHERVMGKSIRSTAMRTISSVPEKGEQKYAEITQQITQSMESLQGANLELTGGSTTLPTTLKGGKNIPSRPSMRFNDSQALQQEALMQMNMNQSKGSSLDLLFGGQPLQSQMQKQAQEELARQKEENAALRAQNEQLMEQVLRLNKQALEANKNTAALIDEISQLKEKLIQKEP